VVNPAARDRVGQIPAVPQCALAFARLFAEAGAPAGVYTNVFASIDQIGRLIEDPRIAGVTVTGSERAGSAVAERAGRSLKKAVMELGGSDPLIVLEDADLQHALAGALFGRMFNTGQSCVSSKRIIVVGRERGETFLRGFSAGLASLQAGDPADPETTLGPLSSKKALDLLLEQIRIAKDGGAEVVLGGERIDRPGYYLHPTILTGINEKNPASVLEFFGPVASLYVVDTEDEAIEVANATPFGLGASVFTGDVDRGRRVARLMSVVITVAPTGPIASGADNPALPTQPDEIAEAVHQAYLAGASVAHIPLRDGRGRPGSPGRLG